jgi:hypothetical protein
MVARDTSLGGDGQAGFNVDRQGIGSKQLTHKRELAETSHAPEKESVFPHISTAKRWVMPQAVEM